MRLLDVNALLASVLEAHEHHTPVNRWIRENREMPLATCALTETSLLRLLMNPVINEDPVDAQTGLALLKRLHAIPRHRFLTELPCLSHPGVEESLRRIQGYRQVTDAYLVALARTNEGKLATFDRKLEAAFGRESVELIEPV